MTSNFSPKFVILTILDGWGIAQPGKGNAISLANIPHMSRFSTSFPHTQLEASGQAVGLPRGEAGNTETGHLNLGAGRIIYQDLERINMSIADGVFFENPVLIDAVHHAEKNNSNLHIMGLVGAGGVHSNMEHLFALLRLVSKMNFQRVFIHIFTDGRDSPPTAAQTYISQIENSIKKDGIGKIASVMGRYWAMDRDQRWDRTQKAYEALTQGIGVKVVSAAEAIQKSYAEKRTDEFVEPSIVVDSQGNPIATVKENDSVIFFNFRIDRPRQLSKAFVFDDFSEATAKIGFDPSMNLRMLAEQTEKADKLGNKEPFKRGPKIKNLYFVTMTEYSKPISAAGAHAAFPPEVVTNPIGAAISSSGKRQLRITESEKERFVTFYFNGLREPPFVDEDRIIVPSAKVKTYDLKPEMSSVELTKTLMQRIQSTAYDFIVVNFPNADMVGHTGNIKAAIQGIEKLDSCLGEISNYVLANNGVLIITADHGNAEEMINHKTGGVDTEHSSNKVPFIAVAEPFMGHTSMLPTGILADVAPTILTLLKIPVPSNMTGRDLLQPVMASL